MADVIVVPRLDEDVGVADGVTPESPGWTPGSLAWAPTVNADGTPARPLLRCNCGTWTGLSKHHIHSDGTVTASVHHMWPHKDVERCGWQVFIRLEGYDGPEFLPEGG